MKRKPKTLRQPSNAKDDKGPDATTLTISPGRRRLLQGLALLAPLVVLGLVEFGLRIAGFGYPTGFFLHSKSDGHTMLMDNPKFGWRFFPPAVARAPRPLFLAAHKPKDTVRIFVFGESAAMGDPEPAYGFARQLEEILQARHPEQKVEVVNAAMTAINSHVIRQIAHDCAPHQGDFWLVFAGNNEVIGPFGAGTVFGRQTPTLAAVRLILALKKARLGQCVAQLARSTSEPVTWEGLELFLRWQIARDDPRLQRVYGSFASNLGDVAEFGRRSGAKVLLATIPVNLRDFPPLASVHGEALRPEQLAEWQQQFSAGTQAQAAGHFADALSHFREAGQIDDEFAQLAFQRACCEMELKESAAAEKDFRLARDLDALRFRADSRINDGIRQTAKAKATLFVDADKELASAEEEWFYDHVHLNFSGNYRVALLFATEFEKHWPGPRPNPSPWLTQGEVVRRLAYTGFDERRVGEEMRARLQQPPFNGQSNFHRRDERWAVAITALSAPAASYVSNYQAALTLAPGDWLLHANFAGLLEAAGDNSQAAMQWAEVCRLLPHSPEGWANRGRLARLSGDTAQARSFLQEGLKQQPDSVETRTELGILEASVGDNQSAHQQFLAALRLQPGFSTARVNLGLLLAHEGNVAGAITEYRQALRWNTNSVGARINLANLLAAQGQNSEALTLYDQAIELEPDNPIARYNFGRLLAAQNRASDAVTNFEVAVRQRPDMGEIHYELGLALTRLGREPEALSEFAQTVRLQPDLSDAHLNYGVALARSGRYSEAAEQFRETLRLHPQDERAQHMLDLATRRQARDR